MIYLKSDTKFFKKDKGLKVEITETEYLSGTGESNEELRTWMCEEPSKEEASKEVSAEDFYGS